MTTAFQSYARGGSRHAFHTEALFCQSPSATRPMDAIERQEMAVLKLMDAVFCQPLRPSPPPLPTGSSVRTRGALQRLGKAFWHQRRRQHNAALAVLQPLAKTLVSNTTPADQLHLHAVTSLALGISMLRTFKMLRAEQALAELHEAAERLGLPRLKHSAQHLEGALLLSQGDFAGAAKQLEEAATGYSALAGQPFLSYLQAQAATDFAWAEIERGDEPRAAEAIDRAQAAVGGNPWAGILLSSMQARIARRLGNCEHASKLYEIVLQQISHLSTDEPLGAIIHDYMGDTLLVWAERTDSPEKERLLAEAERHYREFEHEGRRLAPQQWATRAKYSWAKLHCLAGRFETARKLAEEVRADLQRGEPPPFLWQSRVCCWLARAHFGQNNQEECRRYLQEAKELARRSRSTWQLARALTTAAQIELRAGSLETAINDLGEAQIWSSRRDVDHLLQEMTTALHTVTLAQWRQFMDGLASEKRKTFELSQQLDLWTSLVEHSLTPMSRSGELTQLLYEWPRAVESPLPMSNKDIARLRWLVLQLRVDIESAAWLTGHLRTQDFPVEEPLDLSKTVASLVKGMNQLTDRTKVRPISFFCDRPGDCKVMADEYVVQHVLRALLVSLLRRAGANPFTSDTAIHLAGDEDWVALTLQVDAKSPYGVDSPDPFHADPASLKEARYSADLRLLSCGRILREIGGSIRVSRSARLAFECHWPKVTKPQSKGDRSNVPG